MNDKITLQELFLKVENKPDYINKCITELTKISNTQKRSTKRAILWLLSKGPHTVEEISDHFEISSELVKYLIMELSKANLVVKEDGCCPRYQLNPKKNEVIRFPSVL